MHKRNTNKYLDILGSDLSKKLEARKQKSSQRGDSKATAEELKSNRSHHNSKARKINLNLNNP
jgi:hypothetical protein